MMAQLNTSKIMKGDVLVGLSLCLHNTISDESYLRLCAWTSSHSSHLRIQAVA